MSNVDSVECSGLQHVEANDIMTLDQSNMTSSESGINSADSSVKLLFSDEENDDVSFVSPANLEPIFDLRQFSPVVRLEKITKTTIYNLTKHKDRQRNLRSFIKQQRYNRIMECQKKELKKDRVEDSQKKWKAIQDFLEYNKTMSKDLSKYHREIDFYKPKKRPYIDIDRYSTDRSETSSICGSENYRPRRVVLSPKRFKFESFASSNTRVPKKPFDANISYTVEKICSINLINNEIYFLVKWENYSIKDNTWEPVKNVKNCEELVLEYITEELSGMEESLEKTMLAILDEQKVLIDLYMKRVKREVMEEVEKKFDPFEFRCSQLAYMLVHFQTGFYNGFRKKFRHLVVLKHFKEMEEQQKITHNSFRNEIMEKENNAFEISIENDVDFTCFEPFNYTRENILPQEFQSLNEDFEGCECKSCDRMSKCCPKRMKGNFAYSEYKDGTRLRIFSTQMIFECSEKCKCGKDCPNRLTQQPRKYPLKIFKTDNGRGWGLKAAKSIPRGAYIIEYTGEVIDQEESVRRGEKYDQIGKSYLFDLDFNEKSEAVYTIDAANYGNLSRLINHSCEPNCRIWPVATCNSPIYKLCYFTSRPIKAGEELTIDYSGGTIQDQTDSENENEKGEEKDDLVDSVPFHHTIIQKHRTLDVCKCGSSFCKGKIFI